MNLGNVVRAIASYRSAGRRYYDLEFRRLRLREVVALLAGRRLYFRLAVDDADDEPVEAAAALRVKGLIR